MNVSLEQSLQAYRVYHTPSNLTWKQHYVTETFSNDNILQCTTDERMRFLTRLQESNITIAPSIKAREGKVCHLSDLANTIVNPANKMVAKINRSVVYSSSTGERPIGKTAFNLWNGFQVIDMDIKDYNMARVLKEKIFERLKKYNWFLGVVLSSSQKGLHIYTKIQIPENETDWEKKRILFFSNFRHKYSFVYLACMKLQDELGFNRDQLIQWMDLSMFKPQQGAFIGYDENLLINSNFFEDFIYVNFDNVEDMGYEGVVDWVTYPDLRELFKRWEWFSEEHEEDIEINVKEAKPLEVDTHNKCHYKHHERWRLANTLVKLYGLPVGTRYLRMICTNDIHTKEIQADCVTSSRHQKPVDVWAVNRLNTHHGFKIKLDIDSGESKDEDDVMSVMGKVELIDSPTAIKESKFYKEFNITKTQYLGDIKDELLKNLGRITLIEAGAGVGKTEMVKSLVRDGKKVIMVMPFTSTIKSKVENVDDWYYAYGNRKVKLDGSKGLAMTIDKFSHLNLMDIKDWGFDYIFIDESHLLFQSEYRPIMPKVIEMICNTEVPIILMSGTPIGETIFFEDIIHLKVIKEETRQKEFRVVITDTPGHKLYYLCEAMAKDIVEGRRVLFPTNKGTIFKEQIHAGLKEILESKYAWFEELNVNYYKKSNAGEGFMDDINIKKTISNTHVLLCSTYLSVGVDILDKYKFNIYFDELWMPQEVEQFANRLRANDLYINLFIAKNNAEGENRNIYAYRKLDLNLDPNERKDALALVQLVNASIQRSPLEYKYNTLVSNIIKMSKFIEYDDVDNKYRINVIAYKVINFEHRYRDYVQQLMVLIRGMHDYGYQHSIVDNSGAILNGDDWQAFNVVIHSAKDERERVNATHIDELLEIITEDRLGIYKSVLNGEFDIKKGDEWSENIRKRLMVVKNIEIFEKVIPLFISMTKMYSVEDVKDIFYFCKKGNLYNFAAIKRIRALINIVYYGKQNRLDIPFEEYMKAVYELSEEERTKQEMFDFIQNETVKYAKINSSKEIDVEKSPTTMDTIKKILNDVLKCLCTVKRKNKKIVLERNELIWKEKESDKDLANKQFELGDFLDNLIVTIEEIK